MTAVEIRKYGGVRFALDNFGWIWREHPLAPPGQPRWLRTDVRSFERLTTLISFRLHNA